MNKKEQQHKNATSKSPLSSEALPAPSTLRVGNTNPSPEEEELQDLAFHEAGHFVFGQVWWEGSPPLGLCTFLTIENSESYAGQCRWSIEETIESREFILRANQDPEWKQKLASYALQLTSFSLAGPVSERVVRPDEATLFHRSGKRIHPIITHEVEEFVENLEFTEELFGINLRDHDFYQAWSKAYWLAIRLDDPGIFKTTYQLIDAQAKKLVRYFRRPKVRAAVDFVAGRLIADQTIKGNDLFTLAYETRRILGNDANRSRPPRKRGSKG
jgi:hypothetical protein